MSRAFFAAWIAAKIRAVSCVARGAIGDGRAEAPVPGRFVGHAHRVEREGLARPGTAEEALNSPGPEAQPADRLLLVGGESRLGGDGPRHVLLRHVAPHVATGQRL